MVLATGSVRRGKGGEGVPSCNKTKMHFDDRRTAPFIPGAPVLAAGYSRVQWELGEDKVYIPARRQEIVTGPRIQPVGVG